MNFGVVGAGRWGRNIIHTLGQMPGVRVSCVGSRNPETRALVGLECTIEQDWRRLFQRPGIDAVAVAVPPAVHAEIVSAAVRAGLPVFVEKPLTCDLAEAEQLFALVSQEKGYVLVDHVHLFSHAYRELKRRLPRIGSITDICAAAGAWGPFRADAPLLWDWGPHDAAFCLDLLGTHPLTLSAERLEKQSVDGAWGETLSLSAAYPTGATARIRLTNIAQEKQRTLRVGGPGGTLIYDDCVPHKLVYRPAGAREAEIIDIPGTPPLECALSQFVGNVSTGQISLDDLRFGVGVVRMLDGWQRVLR